MKTNIKTGFFKRAILQLGSLLLWAVLIGSAGAATAHACTAVYV